MKKIIKIFKVKKEVKAPVSASIGKNVWLAIHRRENAKNKKENQKISGA